MNNCNRSMGRAANIDEILIPLSKGDGGVPLFFVHPVGGTVFCYRKVIESLGSNQTCYGIQYPLDSDQQAENLPKSIQELAAFYLDPIRSVCPKGPYAIVGHSFGGMLTYEMAHQLRAAGEEIALIAILDTWVVSVLDPVKREKLKMEIIQKYRELYAPIFSDDPKAETRFVHMQDIGFVYQPPNFGGKIHLFKAESQVDELANIQDRSNFWSDFTNVDICKVPGDHDSMLSGSNAQHLAASLASCVNQVGGARYY